MRPPPKAIAKLAKELQVPQAGGSTKTQQQISFVAGVFELLPRLWRCVSSHTAHPVRQRTAPHGLRSGLAKRIGTPKFEPPKPLTTANVMPITSPSRLMSGPPEPPEVVCAS